MKSPNLFILGAPKCGTTSMADWLSQHPDIFMSPVKEPHHFNTDLKNVFYPDYDNYLSLFKDANSEKFIAESSVWYLFSNDAVKNIQNTYPNNKDIKYIVMLRNPVEMAPALHEEQVYSNNEHILDFKKAFFLEEERKKGNEISKITKDPKLIQYGECCKLGKQVDRLLKQVDKSNVHFIFLEDIKSDPQEEFNKVTNFLDIEKNVPIDFSPKNLSKKRKNQALSAMIKKVGLVKGKLGLTKSIGVLGAINKKNVVARKREKISQELELKLKHYFIEDIKLLSKLVDKDLKKWYI